MLVCGPFRKQDVEEYSKTKVVSMEGMVEEVKLSSWNWLTSKRKVWNTNFFFGL